MVGPRQRGSSDIELNLHELREALDRSLISARYQPIVRIADRQPVALEVLARLDHPVQGTVLPDRFVPQIEDAGLAARLTEVVAARAFADLTAAGLTRHGLLITVNFPLDVLLKTEAIARLDAQRIAAGIPPDMIVVELTESTPVKDFDALRHVLEAVRSRGYSVAIDDVGPAVPGLIELLELPFTSLKLDKDLVIRSGEDPAILDFLRDTTERAHRKGMQVVAEGVETVETWNRMDSIGVDGAQGFLVARPLPAGAVDVWLDAWRSTPAFG
jgi:EAL domain-containing protein (putative c-di-GMP-specific phosphodiesterase class I)